MQPQCQYCRRLYATQASINTNSYLLLCLVFTINFLENTKIQVNYKKRIRHGIADCRINIFIYRVPVQKFKYITGLKYLKFCKI